MRLIKNSPFLEEDPDTLQRLRKGRGRQAAYISSSHTVRRAVRLTSEAETGKIRRAARSLKVTLHCRDGLAAIRDLAYEAYRTRTLTEGRRPTLRRCLPAATLDRLTVNYLRHERTVYDRALLRGNGSTLSDRHVWYNSELKLRCLELIAATFPELGHECERQRIQAAKVLGDHATDPALHAIADAA